MVFVADGSTWCSDMHPSDTEHAKIRLSGKFKE